MKKFFLFLYAFSAFIICLYFGAQIFLKVYFNESFYSTPNFKGLTLEEAKRMDKNHILDIKVAGNEFSSYPEGQIFMQEPTAEKVIKKGRNIKVWISKGSDQFTLPELKGKNLIDITPLLQKEGITIKKVTYMASSLPYNTIIATNPFSGSQVRRGDSLSLLVSDLNSVVDVAMPDVIGLEIEEAKSQLAKNSLSIGSITYKKVDYLDPNIVIESNRVPREKLKAGTVVDLVVSE